MFTLAWSFTRPFAFSVFKQTWFDDLVNKKKNWICEWVDNNKRLIKTQSRSYRKILICKII